MLVLCDFERLGSAEAVYDYLAKEMAFPVWFGRNLDALHDCLTDIGAPTHLILTGMAAPWARAFLPTFQGAAKRNRNLSVEIHEG